MEIRIPMQNPDYISASLLSVKIYFNQFIVWVRLIDMTKRANKMRSLEKAKQANEKADKSERG